MKFKVVKHINPIGSIKSLTKTNFNLCMGECLTIFKCIRDKNVTLMNKNRKYTGPAETTLHQFCLSTDETISG